MAVTTPAFVSWLTRHISSVAFVVGFLWDTLTLTRIDRVYDNVVFISYLLIAFAGILLVHSVDTERWAPAWLAKHKEWLPALVQFPLGGLFSGFFIFYSKSAEFWTSWPFLLLLALLFVGNEFFRRRYERLVFQVSVLHFSLTSYLILVTPVVLGTLGTSTFILATLLSVFVTALILQVIMRLFPDLYRRAMRGVWFAVGGIFVGFHVLYITNLIPPVPLTLKDIGIYHSVVKVPEGYRVEFEAPHKYAFWRTTASIFHRTHNEAAYCFSSVYAPTALRTKIFHSWQRKSGVGAWVREERVGFPLVGGRNEGYRGFTVKTALSDGTWRCVVETENGKVIGQTEFEIVSTDTASNLMRDTR